MADGMGRSCPRLKNIHIASVRLSHAVVLSLTAANLRFVEPFVPHVHFYITQEPIDFALLYQES